MKKNKNIQYILVAMVVAIWGAVVFQFFNFKQDAPVSFELDSSLLFRSMTDSSELETYTLLVNYRDPFLGRMNRRPAERSVAKTYVPKASKTLTKSKNKKAMPLIQYKGYSLNNKRIERVSLALDGRMKSYTLGKQDGDLTLLEMHRDSVVVSWKEFRKTVYRK